MPRNERLTRAELIDPALDAVGWTDDLVREEVMKGDVGVEEIHIGKPQAGRGQDPFVHTSVQRIPLQEEHIVRRRGQARSFEPTLELRQTGGKLGQNLPIDLDANRLPHKVAHEHVDPAVATSQVEGVANPWTTPPALGPRN